MLPCTLAFEQLVAHTVDLPPSHTHLFLSARPASVKRALIVVFLFFAKHNAEISVLLLVHLARIPLYLAAHAYTQVRIVFRNGRGNFKFENGNHYYGDWVDNKRQGIGKMTFGSGT